MTGVHIKRGNLDTEACTQGEWEHKCREIRAVSTSQAMPRIARRPPETRVEDVEQIFLAGLKWKPPCWHLDLRFLACRNQRQWMDAYPQLHFSSRSTQTMKMGKNQQGFIKSKSCKENLMDYFNWIIKLVWEKDLIWKKTAKSLIEHAYQSAILNEHF